jgi:hypothetical protein
MTKAPKVEQTLGAFVFLCQKQRAFIHENSLRILYFVSWG